MFIGYNCVGRPQGVVRQMGKWFGGVLGDSWDVFWLFGVVVVFLAGFSRGGPKQWTRNCVCGPETPFFCALVLGSGKARKSKIVQLFFG